MRNFNASALDALWGNARLKRCISGAAAAGALCHAYIFEGAPGSGRHTAAMLTALAAACPQALFPCLECETCRKLRGGLSPDFITVLPEPDRKTLGVEAVRAIAETVYILPNDLEAKFYLIPDADAMTIQAQNALLKLLEEPPSGVYFLLLCENSANLLPTVKSRAPALKLQKFTDAELEALLLKNEKSAARLKSSDEAAFARSIRLADGSVGAALELLDLRKSGRTQAQYERVETFFKLLAADDCAVGSNAVGAQASGVHSVGAHAGGAHAGCAHAIFTAFALSLADKRDQLAELLSLVSSGARDLLAYKYGAKTPPTFFTDENAVAALAGKFTAGRLIAAARYADEARGDLAANANLYTSLAALAARLNS